MPFDACAENAIPGLFGLVSCDLSWTMLVVSTPPILDIAPEVSEKIQPLIVCKFPSIFGNSQKPRFARMKKPNSVEHDENGIGELLVTSPICAETKQNGSRIALRSRLKG